MRRVMPVAVGLRQREQSRIRLSLLWVDQSQIGCLEIHQLSDVSRVTGFKLGQDIFDNRITFPKLA